ncbi:hypothetical protein [Candidatus Galacturonibacter soehngenii]|nr:hypothetical protein [Candidatus Galacturonibacter soehngenii]
MKEEVVNRKSGECMSKKVKQCINNLIIAFIFPYSICTMLQLFNKRIDFKTLMTYEIKHIMFFSLLTSAVIGILITDMHYIMESSIFIGLVVLLLFTYFLYLVFDSVFVLIIIVAFYLIEFIIHMRRNKT